MEKLHNYCFDCDIESVFTIIFVEEEVKIKKESFLVMHKYYKCSLCGELFEPLDDIDYNLDLDYSMYRKLKGYLQPAEIKHIREKYKLSQRQFAELLGFSHATISNIENGSLQNKQQNSIFVMASCPQAFKLIIESNENDLQFVEVKKTIEKLIIAENKKLEETINEIQKLAKQNWENISNLKSRVNILEYDAKPVEKSINVINIKGAKKPWKIYFPILTQN